MEEGEPYRYCKSHLSKAREGSFRGQTERAAEEDGRGEEKDHSPSHLSANWSGTLTFLLKGWLVRHSPAASVDRHRAAAKGLTRKVASSKGILTLGEQEEEAGTASPAGTTRPGSSMQRNCSANIRAESSGDGNGAGVRPQRLHSTGFAIISPLLPLSPRSWWGSYLSSEISPRCSTRASDLYFILAIQAVIDEPAFHEFPVIMATTVAQSTWGCLQKQVWTIQLSPKWCSQRRSWSWPHSTHTNAKTTNSALLAG